MKCVVIDKIVIEKLKNQLNKDSTFYLCQGLQTMLEYQRV